VGARLRATRSRGGCDTSGRVRKEYADDAVGQGAHRRIAISFLRPVDLHRASPRSSGGGREVPDFNRTIGESRRVPPRSAPLPPHDRHQESSRFRPRHTRVCAPSLDVDASIALQHWTGTPMADVVPTVVLGDAAAQVVRPTVEDCVSVGLRMRHAEAEGRLTRSGSNRGDFRGGYSR